MAISYAVKLEKSMKERGLYLVPQRRVGRLPHAPAGRALHLVDVENLMRGPCQGPRALVDAVEHYRVLAPVHLGDHIVIATNPALAYDAGRTWPTARLLVGPGQDGADRALLTVVSDPVWVASRYDKVVFGSGDGIFADTARELRTLGIPVGVVAPQNGLSHRLANNASFFRLIPAPTLKLVA